MRSLGRALNVDPMAIHHHVPHKAALLSGVNENVITDLFAHTTTGPEWQPRLQDVLRRFRTLATQNFHVFPGLIASPKISPGRLRAGDAVLGILLDADF
jgi:hypothetical protein